MNTHSGNIFKSNGIIFPTKYSSKYFNINDEDSEHMNLNEKKQQLELPLLEDQLHTE